MIVRRLAAVLALAAAALPAALSAAPVTAGGAPPPDLIFTEYIEGTSNNKALEIFNGSASAVDLAANAYNVQMFFNGSATAGLTINLAGTVAAGDVFVLAQASASGTILAQADQTSSAGWFNGDDAVVLRKGTTVIDSIGQAGSDPGTEWGTGLTSTADNTLRKPTPCTADTTPTDAFDPASAWAGFATDTFDGIGFYTAVDCDRPVVLAVTPAPGATGVARDANVTATFDEPVNTTAGTFSLTCADTGAHALSVSGGPTTYTLDPTTDFAANELCTLSVTAATVTDQDDPIATMAGDFTSSFTTTDATVCGDPATLIHDIQGSGATSPMTGSIVSIEGVVVGDYQGIGQFNGFHVQEEDADVDGSPLTSEGIFVFSTLADVNQGDRVRVRGTVTEFTSSGQQLTELASVTSILTCDTGASVTAAVVDLPVAAVTDLEHVEGMSVAFADSLTVSETFTLARFGELVLSVDGRQYAPTAVAEPGAPALAVQDLNNRSRIVLDDGDNRQNIDPTIYPAGGLSAANTLRVGDTVPALSGVLEQRFGVYRVQPQVAGVAITHTNPRPVEPEDVGGNVQVASVNVLNYFNGDGLGGGFPTSRGANTVFEFGRQRAKTISAIIGLGAEIVGLMEIENDVAGAGPTAIEDLVAGLNDATAPGTWAYVDTGKIGTDEIRVALIYQPAAVTPVGSFAVLTSAFDPDFIDTLNRPTLAQTFMENVNGGTFTVAVNHLKSKGSDCNAVGDPDTGDGQGNCAVTRAKAAAVLAEWLATDPTGSGDPDTLIIGDLNSYTMEDSIAALEAAGYTNMIRAESGLTAYSYVFQGTSGYLDHALADETMADQISGVTEWHINADEPIALDYNVEFKTAGQVVSFYDTSAYRNSDHDPVLVGICQAPELSIALSPDVLLVPNHKYARITATPTFSSDVAAGDVELVSVVSNESDNGADDGDTINDIRIDSDFSVRVRAERSGVGTGRVYTFTYQATNSCGATVTATATVTVPVL